MSEIPLGWMTTAQVARVINRSERIVQQLAKDGKLRSKPRPGRPTARIYEVNSVNQYLTSGPGETTALGVPKPAPSQVVETGAIIKALCQEFRAEREHQHAAEFLALPEAASFLRLPKAHLQRAIAEGRLTAIKAGGVWRIRRSVLETFEG